MAEPPKALEGCPADFKFILDVILRVDGSSQIGAAKSEVCALFHYYWCRAEYGIGGL